MPSSSSKRKWSGKNRGRSGPNRLRSANMPESEYNSRMKPALLCAVALAATAAKGQNPAPNPDSQYRLGPDSMAQEGVPKGEIRGPFTLPSQVFPGTQHTYFVYVPAQYDASKPAALMIFNDGQAFL